MSFLYDAALPGSTRLHLEPQIRRKSTEKGLTNSESQRGLLSPLVQLIRDPVKAIGDAVGTLGNVQDIPSPPRLLSESRRQALYLRLKEAKTFEQWRGAVTELDKVEGNDVWKAQDESPEYDYTLVAARLKQLDDARLSCDVGKMIFLVRTSLTRNLGGMGDLRLYKHSHIGTKNLIERYIESAQKTLAALLEVSSNQRGKTVVQERKLLESLLAARQAFGRSALLLSGGGTFGMNHIGVVKCLWETHLLPRIISGASAGSIVCAVLCTKTDAEMPQVLQEFCFGDLAVFEREGEEEGLLKKAARFLKYGSLFDISHLMNVMKNILGDLTFQEAYNRTRRILNITVSSASLYELPRLLNYVTAPNVLIWSAVCASCSVPFVFSAASLLAKDPKTGKHVPWNPMPAGGWIDGSVDNDLPMTRLAEMFNVNHFIVSQVNPHVVPFLSTEEEIIGMESSETAFGAGPTWVRNMANFAKDEALHRLHVLAELGIFPNTATKARSILNQRYSGDITIFPSISYAHFPKVLSNPTSEFMLQCMLNGERATWPRLSRIKNHLAIELALDETIRQLRARVVFSPDQVNVRLNNFNRPMSQGGGSSEHRDRPRKMLRFDPGTAPATPSLLSTSPVNPMYFHPPPELPVSKPYVPAHPNSSASRVPSTSPNPELTSSDGDFSTDSEPPALLNSPSPSTVLCSSLDHAQAFALGSPSAIQNPPIESSIGSPVFSHVKEPLYLNPFRLAPVPAGRDNRHLFTKGNGELVASALQRAQSAAEAGPKKGTNADGGSVV